MCENMQTVFRENLLAANVKQQGTPLIKGTYRQQGIVWPRCSQQVYNTCIVAREDEGVGLDNKTIEFMFLGIDMF